MSRRALLFPLLALSMAALLWLARHGGGTPPDVHAPARPRVESAAVAAPRPAAREAVLPPAPRTEDAQEDAAAAPPTSVEGWTVHGLVVDLSGAPVAGLTVSDESAARATTTGDGRFALALSGSAARLRASGAGWCTVQLALAERVASEPAVIVVARTAHFAGRVVDVERAPVGSARFRITPDLLSAGGFAHSLERTAAAPLAWEARADGTFAQDVPAVPGWRVHVEAAEHYPSGQALPAADRTDAVVILQRMLSDGLHGEPLLFGAVRRPDGSAVPGATVTLEDRRGVTDADGRWTMRRPDYVPEDGVLVARAAGWQPAIVRERVWEGGGERLGPLDLTLPGPELALSGRAVDAAGAPLVDWTVTALPADALGVAGEDAVRTDERGAFRIGGLGPTAWTLRAEDPRGELSLAGAGPFAAGTTDVTLTLPADAWLERVAGVVRAHDGRPCAGARVELVRDGQARFSASAAPDGTFALGPVPRRGLQLAVRGPGVEDLALPAGTDLAVPLDVRVWRRVELSVDLSGRPRPPRTMRVLDDAGRALPLWIRDAEHARESRELTLRGGRSGVVSVRETARVLELDGGTERLPLALVAGRLNEVR